MLQSKLFTKTRREAPKDEVSKNAGHLVRAGFIYKEMAGVYDFLPLGLRTIEKIVQIIREEMNSVGGQELQLSSLQDKSVWQATERWSDDVLDIWFKTKLKNDTEVGLATTHEEPLTRLMSEYVKSYKDLPALAYQFQTKFRNELRAKSGLMRTREFLMKDLYSFSKNEEEHEAVYEELKEAYKRIFERLGIGEKTYLTFASGGSFSKFSHEFQTVTDAGEDVIYIDEEKNIAVNKEVLTDEVLNELGLQKKNLKEKKAVEVGNIFSLGTKFSEPLKLSYSDENGESHPVVMGSYGIGPARVMGAIVEVSSEDGKMVWPYAVSPFLAHIIEIPGSELVKKQAQELYDELSSKGIDVLYDDRDSRAGEKFADADLIGIPIRIIISDKSLEKGGVEWHDLLSKKEEVCGIKEACDKTERLKV